jgi:hypothetical protein
VVPKELRVLFCERFNCPPSEFEERLLRECLYRHARLLAPVLKRLQPGFFAEDLKLVRYLGASNGLREAGVDLMNFRDANRGARNFWRNRLRIRASGRKAARLAQRLFAEANGRPAQPVEPVAP